MNTTTATKPQFDTVDAATVQIDPNIRTEAILDDEFLASIGQYGVIVPVLGRRAPDGTIYIRAGQRRTLAAKQLGKPLPVFWFEGTDDATEPAWLATVLQIVENDHRAPLTTGQRVAAYRQLELDGLSVTKIAQALTKPKDQVKAALAISKSEKTLAIASQYDVDLLQLAAMVEFEDDAETSAELLETALDEPDQFEHALSAARQNKERRTLIRNRRDELEAAGKKTVDSREISGNAQRMSSLERDDTVTVDPELGDGIVTYVQVNYNGELIESEWVIDPTTYGYKYKYSSSSSAPSGPMTDEQKAARRRVIACNKAWDAAEPVRADWLVEFLSRKTLPKDAASVIAVAFTRYGYEMREHGDHLAHQLLGVEEVGGRHVDALATLVEQNPAKAGLVMIALTLGKLEAGTSRNTWRSPQPVDRFYLDTIRGWGYSLSPVELIALGEATDLPDTGEEIADVDLEDFEAEEDAPADGE